MMQRLLLVFVMLGLWLPLSAAPLPAADTAPMAPDFTLDQRGGGQIRLSDLRGQVVMVNFWASWCGPCRQEMPHLEVMYQDFSDQGFQLLGVNTDQKPELAERLLNLIPVSFPILFDSASEVSRAYAVDAMPTTLLIDRQGRLRHTHRAYRPGYEDMYRQQLEALLDES